MSRIGFTGLGIMGAPMAANQVKAGHEVAGRTHEQAATDRLAGQGGRPAPAIADAVEGAGFVTVLPDWPQVDEVVLEPGGVVEKIRAASSRTVRHIDFSTIRPETG